MRARVDQVVRIRIGTGLCLTLFWSNDTRAPYDILDSLREVVMDGHVEILVLVEDANVALRITVIDRNPPARSDDHAPFHQSRVDPHVTKPRSLTGGDLAVRWHSDHFTLTLVPRHDVDAHTSHVKHNGELLREARVEAQLEVSHWDLAILIREHHHDKVAAVAFTEGCHSRRYLHNIAGYIRWCLNPLVALIVSWTLMTRHLLRPLPSPSLP